MTAFSDEDYEHWLEHGYVVHQLLDVNEVAAALEGIDEHMPSWDDYARHPRWYAETVGRTGFIRVDFPFGTAGLDHTTVHPDLVAFAERVLRTRQIMLSHGQLGGKYAGTKDFEQPLHVDYGNNMLVVPNPDEIAFDVPALLYYTEVTIDLGPTYVVPQEHTRDDPLMPRHRFRNEHPAMYEHELAVTVPAGWVLVYSMRTFHRGSRLEAREGLRYAQNIGFKRCDTLFCGQETFQHEGGSSEMDRYLVAGTPRQRELVGFPAVGDPYWTPDSLAATARRYPHLDLSPYALTTDARPEPLDESMPEPGTTPGAATTPGDTLPSHAGG